MPLFTSAVPYTGAIAAVNLNTQILTAGSVVTTDLSAANTITRSLTRTIPTTVGDEVDIGTFTLTQGSAVVEVWFTIAGTGYSQTKKYIIPAQYHATAGAWQSVQALTSTGKYFSQDADLEVNQLLDAMALRIRRTLGTTAATAYITLFLQGIITDVFTPSTSTSSVSAPTAGYVVFGERTQIGQTPDDLGSYSLSNWNATGYPSASFFKSKTVSGAGGGGTILPSEPAIILSRSGISFTTYPNFVEFKVGRYENPGPQSRTCLDIALTHGNGDAAGTNVIHFRSDGSIGIGTIAPTAVLHLKAGTTAASTAPLKFTSGSLQTTAEAGTKEFLAERFYVTPTSLARQVIPGVLFTQTADATVTNTVAETTIVGSGVGSITLPANFFVTGKSIRVRIGGVYSTPLAATPSVIVKVKYGSTVIATVTTTSLLSGGTDLEFDGEVFVTCRTTGSSGTVMTHGDIEYSTGVAGTIAVNPLNNAGATTTINTTTSNALDVTVQWDTATSTRIVKATSCSVEVLN